MDIETYLNRIVSNDEGTIGIFSVPAFKFSCYSIELPNRNNERNYSRINKGKYLAKWTQSTKFGIVPLLHNVQGRSGILIHSGNYAGDARKKYLTHSQGCILLGDKLGIMNGQKSVLNSKSTLMKFDKLMNRQNFYITIN